MDLMGGGARERYYCLIILYNYSGGSKGGPRERYYCLIISYNYSGGSKGLRSSGPA